MQAAQYHLDHKDEMTYEIASKISGDRLLISVADSSLYSLIEKKLRSEGYEISDTVLGLQRPLSLYYDLLITDLVGLSRHGLLKTTLFLRTLVLKHGEGAIVTKVGDDVMVIDPTCTDLMTTIRLLAGITHLERQNRMLQKIIQRGSIDSRSAIIESDPASSTLRDRVKQFEFGLIVQALRECRGNCTSAARLLKTKKTTLYMKLKHYAIDASAFF